MLTQKKSDYLVTLQRYVMHRAPVPIKHIAVDFLLSFVLQYGTKVSISPPLLIGHPLNTLSTKSTIASFIFTASSTRRRSLIIDM